MKKFIALLLLSLLLPLSAHAGLFGKDEWEKEDCPKNHSLAWCIADYQGRSKGIHDMTKEEFVAALAKAGINDETQIANILHSSLGVATGVGNFALGNLFGGGVFMLHALMPGPAELFKRDPYVVFFDERTGRTEQQMADDFNTAVLQAMELSVSTIPGIAVTEVKKEVGGRYVRYFRLTTTNTDCVNDNICSIGSAGDRYKMSSETRALPSYLGMSPVVSPRVGANADFWFAPPKGVNRADLAKAISEKLPDYIYWFIPVGYLGGNPFPMVLNQGKALFFVKPDPNEPAPMLPHVAARLKNEEKSVSRTTPDTPKVPGVMQTSNASNQAANADQ